MSKRNAWSKTVTDHGVSVRLFERKGTIYRDVVVGRTVSANGRPRTQHDIRSLRHSDRAKAETQAKALCEALAERRLTVEPGAKLTVGQLFAWYRTHRLPTLQDPRRREAEARMAMFVEAWGRSLPILDLSQSHVDTYVRKRRNLEVVAPGLRADDEGNRRRGYREPKPARDGALHGELSWLSTCCNQASGFRKDGKRLLSENPLKGLKWPREKNPRRPVASHQRYVATQEHTDTIDPAGRLRCILAVARYTGRRESAICGLTVSDILLTEDRIRDALAQAGRDERDAEDMPHGAIRWRDEIDKEGFLFISPINVHAREELERYLRRSRRIGDAALFPAPGKPEAPIGRDRAAKWLVRAEKLAEQPKLVGGVFHPYRRLWASERQHLPDVAVAEAGGWRDTRALKTSYQKATAKDVQKVVDL